MSRPEDVSQEAWDQAETHRQLWARGPCTIKEAVARAITAAVAAEREACFQAANQALYSPISDGCPINVPSDAGFYMAAKIMSAIRARSTSC